MRWITVSIDEMAMIAYLCAIRRERFLANVTTRRATVHLPLFFRHCFDSVSMHVSGYDSFYTMQRKHEQRT